MYQEFMILSVENKLEDKKIIINTNFDIDKDSINSANVILFCLKDSSEVLLTYDVIDNQFIIHIQEDLVPNVEYVLKVSNIRNIIGQRLVSGLIRHYIYKTKIKVVPQIVSPVNYQEIDNSIDISLSIEEIKLDDYSFEVEISSDVGFINIVRSTEIDKSGKVVLSPLPIGQYFIRSRLVYIEDGKKFFSDWSNKITFLSVAKNDDVDDKKDNIDNKDDDIKPEYKKEIKLVNYPTNGETPESFVLEFSDNIDPNFQGEVYVIRRDT